MDPASILALSQVLFAVLDTVMDARRAQGIDGPLSDDEYDAIRQAAVDRYLARYRSGRDAMIRALDAADAADATPRPL